MFYAYKAIFTMVVKKMKDFFSYWYFQYLLSTSVYMLEPMEQRIFNCFLVLVTAMFMYTSYVFIPDHISNFVNFILYHTHGSSPNPEDLPT